MVEREWGGGKGRGRSGEKGEERLKRWLEEAD